MDNLLKRNCCADGLTNITVKVTRMEKTLGNNTYN